MRWPVAVSCIALPLIAIVMVAPGVMACEPAGAYMERPWTFTLEEWSEGNRLTTNIGNTTWQLDVENRSWRLLEPNSYHQEGNGYYWSHYEGGDAHASDIRFSEHPYRGDQWWLESVLEEDHGCGSGPRYVVLTYTNETLQDEADEREDEGEYDTGAYLVKREWPVGSVHAKIGQEAFVINNTGGHVQVTRIWFNETIHMEDGPVMNATPTNQDLAPQETAWGPTHYAYHESPSVVHFIGLSDLGFETLELPLVNATAPARVWWVDDGFTVVSSSHIYRLVQEDGEWQLTDLANGPMQSWLSVRHAHGASAFLVGEGKITDMDLLLSHGLYGPIARPVTPAAPVKATLPSEDGHALALFSERHDRLSGTVVLYDSLADPVAVWCMADDGAETFEEVDPPDVNGCNEFLSEFYKEMEQQEPGSWAIPNPPLVWLTLALGGTMLALRRRTPPI